MNESQGEGSIFRMKDIHHQWKATVKIVNPLYVSYIHSERSSDFLKHRSPRLLCLVCMFCPYNLSASIIRFRRWDLFSPLLWPFACTSFQHDKHDKSETAFILTKSYYSVKNRYYIGRVSPVYIPCTSQEDIFWGQRYSIDLRSRSIGPWLQVGRLVDILYVNVMASSSSRVLRSSR